MTDVIIAGAGPTGLTLANLLGAAGIVTLLIERDTGLSAFPKALMVDDEYARLLASVGLGDGLRAQGVYPISYEWQSPLGYKIAYNVGRYTQNNFPNRTAISQPNFERMLLEGAFRSPEFTARFGEEVVGIEQDRAGVSVRVRDTTGAERTHRAAYLVGADGASSITRKLLGIDFEDVAKFDERSIVVDVADDPDTSTTARARAGWRRSVSSLPAPGGRRYEFKVRRGEDADVLLTDASLTRLFAPLREFKDLKIIRRALYAYRSKIATAFGRGRVFLAGDAAHIMPVTGSQGMNSGARDANNLAWKLIQVLNGTAAHTILATYHDERYAHVRDTIRVVTAQTKLRAIRPFPIMFARDLAVGAALLVPAFRRYVANMGYMPKPFVRSGIVIDAPPDERAGLTGRVMPNPAVRQDSRVRLLDEVVQRTWFLAGIATTSERPRGLDHPLWQQLGAVTLRLTDDASPAAEQLSVVEPERFSELFANHRGQWLIVRPDRVVAAAVSPDHLSATADSLAALLDASRELVTHHPDMENTYARST